MLRIAMYTSRRSRWTSTEEQMVSIMDSKRHTEVTRLAVYIPLHVV